MKHRHVVIGGGAYGCYAALKLAEAHGGETVTIVEREDDILRRASYHNQARVHNGYHYPRSMLTGLRSRINAPRFMAEFKGAIVADFEHFYAIARQRSKVTPSQFQQFCRRIGAPTRPAPAAIRRLFDEDLIEAVFAVSEYAFDADRLRAHFREHIEARGITLRLGTEALKVEVGAGFPAPDLTVRIADRRSGEWRDLAAAQVYNCCYSALNGILARSGLQTIRLRHEATEMALVEPPPALQSFAVTVMCGPFFSLMPFPPRGLASLSHVGYTPHYSWVEDPQQADHPEHRPDFPLASHFDRMRRDAARYLPAMAEATYVDSLWEVKTILPQSEANDSRPILFKPDPAAPNLVSLLGSKVDNIYDLDDVIGGVQHPRFAASPA